MESRGCGGLFSPGKTASLRCGGIRSRTGELTVSRGLGRIISIGSGSTSRGSGPNVSCGTVSAGSDLNVSCGRDGRVSPGSDLNVSCGRDGRVSTGEVDVSAGSD